MFDKRKLNRLSKQQISKLKDLEPDALPLPENAEDLMDVLPEEDEFESPRYEKPVPGEGPL
ncbi:MAG: hypothetical protein KDC80_13880 [Saprospiraceae bacterium]|nr:hypothetical protein [Saprospiraceae bacterium]